MLIRYYMRAREEPTRSMKYNVRYGVKARAPQHRVKRWRKLKKLSVSWPFFLLIPEMKKKKLFFALFSSQFLIFIIHFIHCSLLFPFLCRVQYRWWSAKKQCNSFSHSLASLPCNGLWSLHIISQNIEFQIPKRSQMTSVAFLPSSSHSPLDQLWHRRRWFRLEHCKIIHIAKSPQEGKKKHRARAFPFLFRTIDRELCGWVELEMFMILSLSHFLPPRDFLLEQYGNCTRMGMNQTREMMMMQHGRD